MLTNWTWVDFLPDIILDQDLSAHNMAGMRTTLSFYKSIFCFRDVVWPRPEIDYSLNLVAYRKHLVISELLGNDTRGVRDPGGCLDSPRIFFPFLGLISGE